MDDATPIAFHLSRNYPDPFSEKTTIKYCVAYKTRVQISVYDAENNLIEKLVDEEKKSGTYEVEFSVSSCHSGERRNLTDGYYFYQMTAGDYSSDKKWLCINKLSGGLNMKSFLQTLFFFLLVAQICFGQWYQQNSPTTQNLNAVIFIDASNGWAVGGGGIVLNTTNGGSNWNVQSTAGTNTLNAVYFKDENTGWVVSDGGYYDTSSVFHTFDGGTTWSPQIKISASTLNDVFFLDDNIGFAGGHTSYLSGLQSILLKTTNGGESWILSIDTLGPIRKIYFVNQNTGWVLSSWAEMYGFWSAIFKTEDGGASWSKKLENHSGGPRGGDPAVFDIYFKDFNNGIAIGDVVYRTTDGGDSWLDTLSFTQAATTNIFVGQNNQITAVGWYGMIFKSLDGGVTWNAQNSGSTNSLYSVFFTDALSGWAVGDNGTIIHTTNGGVSFVKEEQITGMPTEFLLSQNYPNPFNPSTKIKYSVPQISNVVIKVFDILGNEIETLVNEEKPRGTYEVTWYAENLPSGVYFYQLKVGNFIETKKILLLK